MTWFSHCADIDANNRLSMSEKHFSQIAFDPNGLAVIHIADAVYYINKNGKSARSYLFDNGADYFANGLARTVHNNKVGFMDKNLDIVIPPIYDFAFPFENGRARVCMKCKRISTGEHAEVRGGRWGYIAPSGQVLVEISYTREELENMSGQ